MKKISLFLFALISVFLLVSCDNTDEIIGSIENDYSQQQDSINDIIDRIDSIESNLINIQTQLENIVSSITNISGLISNDQDDIDNLDQLYQTLVERIQVEEISSDEITALVAELKLFIYNPVDISQIDETLDGTMNLVFPTFDLGYNYVFESADIVITHPLTLESGSSDIIMKQTLNNEKNSLDFELPYHGLFNFEIIYTFSDGTSNFSHTYNYEYSFSASHYNLTWLNATMPVLLFATDLLSGKYDSGYTYVEIERARTFDYSKFPDRTLPYPVYASPSLGNYDQSQVPNFYESIDPIGSTNNYAYQWIDELFSINSNSTFTFIGVDNIDRAVTVPYMLNIPEDQFHIVMYTDGAYTTGTINTYYHTMDDYNTRLENFVNWKNSKLNRTDLVNHFDTKNLLAASEFTNIEYVVNNDSSWSFDLQLKTYLLENNITVLPVENAFQNVINDNKLIDLEYLLKTRWGDLPEESMASYFDLSPKDNLLILGTSPSAEASTSYATFDKYIQYILDTYGNDYDIFYKGHPRYPSDETRIAYFEANNITELVSSIPVETLMLLYSNVYVGGYTSTSFQSSLEGQTLFFFGSVTVIDNNATLANMISEGIIFANTAYLIPDINGNVVVE
ncbi:MAG: hypothetical protein AB7E61_01480 [Acholeplasmataceae bacterium]